MTMIQVPRKLVALSTLFVGLYAFPPVCIPLRTKNKQEQSPFGTFALASTKDASESNSCTSTVQTVQKDVEKLKTVLQREYLTFFDPMETSYYAPTVQFVDPLNNLQGVSTYQQNVDMLSGRTVLGKLLFRNANIVLHTIQGGDVTEQPAGDRCNSTTSSLFCISNIITRWTLTFTFSILPWKPTPTFSGISNYTLAVGGPAGVQILEQQDYWDSIDLKNDDGGIHYQRSSRIDAIAHFVDLLKPKNLLPAPPAGALELPYTLLRIKKQDEYQVRRYPSYQAVRIEYHRRDVAFERLATLTKDCTTVLAPAIMEITTTQPTTTTGSSSTTTTTKKTMLWPIAYAMPGQPLPVVPPPIFDSDDDDDDTNDSYEIIVVPERVVAIRPFSDPIVEPVVRTAHRTLQTLLARDGLLSPANADTQLLFAQYDAVFSMGQRRSEVHIPLQEGGHPW